MREPTSTGCAAGAALFPSCGELGDASAGLEEGLDDSEAGEAVSLAGALERSVEEDRKAACIGALPARPALSVAGCVVRLVGTIRTAAKRVWEAVNL